MPGDRRRHAEPAPATTGSGRRGAEKRGARATRVLAPADAADSVRHAAAVKGVRMNVAAAAGSLVLL
jgi:hypothetical protein